VEALRFPQWPPGSEEQFQPLPDEVLGAGAAAGFLLDGFDGFVGIDLFIPEGDEGEDGVVEEDFGGRGGVGGAGGFPSGGDADFVLELDDDALGGLFADAFGAGEGGGVAADDGGFEAGDADAAEDVEGSLWPDSPLTRDQVRGIGPKTALDVLSGISVTSFKAAVVSGDAAALARTKGIGKKTAERIIVELKDKVGIAPLGKPPAPPTPPRPPKSSSTTPSSPSSPSGINRSMPTKPSKPSRRSRRQRQHRGPHPAGVETAPLSLEAIVETEAPPPSRGLLLRVFWTLLTVLVIGYPLSIGPLNYWFALNDVQTVPGWWPKVYWPLEWLVTNAQVVEKPLDKYKNFLLNSGQTSQGAPPSRPPTPSPEP